MLKVKTNGMKWLRYLRRHARNSKRHGVDFMIHHVRRNIQLEIDKYVAASPRREFRYYMLHESGGWAWFYEQTSSTIGVTLHTRRMNLLPGKSPSRDSKHWLWVICGKRDGTYPPNYICLDITKESGLYMANHFRQDGKWLLSKTISSIGLPT